MREWKIVVLAITSPFASRNSRAGQAKRTSFLVAGHCLISYRGGLGTSLCIMGYGTQHPHSRKEHIELYNILKFGVNQANIRRDTAIQKLKKFTKKCMERRTHVRRSIHFLVKFGVFEWLYLS